MNNFFPICLECRTLGENDTAIGEAIAQLPTDVEHMPAREAAFNAMYHIWQDLDEQSIKQ